MTTYESLHSSRTAEALLIYLMCQNRSISRQVLADFFWEERSPERVERDETRQKALEIYARLKAEDGAAVAAGKGISIAVDEALRWLAGD